MPDTSVTTDTWNGHRFVKHGRWKWVIVLLIVVGGVVGVVVATSGGGRSSSPASGLCNDRLTQMEERGAMQAMTEQHQRMLEQMRVAVTPQMQLLMDADPMWKLMRTGEWTEMFEDQQTQIDRMLGAPSSCGAR